LGVDPPGFPHAQEGYDTAIVLVKANATECRGTADVIIDFFIEKQVAASFEDGQIV
jgi:hypothetical protein